MHNILAECARQGYRTMAYPAADPPPPPDRLRGLPILDSQKCREGCRDCAEACPTDAIAISDQGPRLDMGRCLFCTDCQDACPEGAIRYTTDHGLASRTRDGLIINGKPFQAAAALDDRILRLFGRSFNVRVVSAGGCNGCEADVNVLTTIVFDLSRFGINVVASPRHADALVITGPVTQNMKLALKKCYDAMPSPKLVIAIGACAISGGPYIDHAEVNNGAASVVPVDLYIPGCPPHPLTILDGLLRLLDRLEQNK